MPKYNSSEELLRCAHEGCDREFKRKSDLNRHFSTHSGAKPHLCTWQGCEMKFNQISALNTHMNVHTGAQPHVCTVCGARFGDPSSRGRHEEEIHNPSKGTFLCPFMECRSSIKRRSAFTQHLRIKHQIRLNRVEIDSCNPMLKEQPPASGRIPRRPGRGASKTTASSASNKVPFESESIVSLAPSNTDLFYPDLSVLSTVAPSYRDIGSLCAGQMSSSLMSSYDHQQNYQVPQPVYGLPFISASLAPSMLSHSEGCLPVAELYAESIPSRPHSTVESPALSFASSASSSSSASPSPAPELMGLYPTVQYGTSELRATYAFLLDEEQGTTAGGCIKLNTDLDMFLATLNGAADSFDFGLEDPFRQNWDTVDHGIAVVG